MRIIPAIDIMNGQCVRLQKGDFSTRKVYADDPLKVAADFREKGVEWLHMVDLDGARDGKVVNWDTIERVAAGSGLKIDFGGGVRTHDEVDRLLQAGVQQINVGSLAVRSPETLIQWMKTFGAEKFILSVDVKDGLVATHGWTSTSDLKAETFIEKFTEQGLQYVVSTDVSRDGMMSGTNLELYKQLVKGFPDLKIIASGGVSREQDVLDLLPVGVDGVILGKAIYEGTVDLESILRKC